MYRLGTNCTLGMGRLNSKRIFNMCLKRDTSFSDAYTPLVMPCLVLFEHHGTSHYEMIWSFLCFLRSRIHPGLAIMVLPPPCLPASCPVTPCLPACLPMLTPTQLEESLNSWVSQVLGATWDRLTWAASLVALASALASMGMSWMGSLTASLQVSQPCGWKQRSTAPPSLGQHDRAVANALKTLTEQTGTTQPSHPLLDLSQPCPPWRSECSTFSHPRYHSLAYIDIFWSVLSMWGVGA